MRDVIITVFIFILLFMVLTTKITSPMGNLSVETLEGLHSLLSQLIFWAGTLYLCATGTFGALMRQDRFGLSHKHPMLNRFLSLMLLISPFLAVLVDARFVLLMLGLLALSHIRSKTDDEQNIQIGQSRAFSNILLIPIFTLALMLMTMNNYKIGSIFDIRAYQNKTQTVHIVDDAQEMEDTQ